MAVSEAKKLYHNEYIRRRYRTDPEFRAKQRARNARNDERYRTQVTALLVQFREAGCRLCGESDPACLTAHHLDQESKEFNLGDARNLKVSGHRVALELSKCICLCANCHAKVHAGTLAIVAKRS